MSDSDDGADTKNYTEIPFVKMRLSKVPEWIDSIWLILNKSETEDGLADMPPDVGAAEHMGMSGASLLETATCGLRQRPTRCLPRANCCPCADPSPPNSSPLLPASALPYMHGRVL